MGNCCGPSSIPLQNPPIVAGCSDNLPCLIEGVSPTIEALAMLEQQRSKIGSQVARKLS